MLPNGLDFEISGGLVLLIGALVLGIRHGFDWDHIAAITDITATAVTAGGPAAVAVHPDSGQLPQNLPETPANSDIPTAEEAPSRRRWIPPRRPMMLGTLYALGHASVVAALGLAAYLMGAVLPSWVDSVMGRVVGLTLLALGAWLVLAAYKHARYGHEFHLRSRWMVIFDWTRRLRDRISGRPSTPRPPRTQSYGAGTSYGIGMIHGIGAETATQVLLITALGGAAGQGLGIPLMLAFIIGLVLANTVIVGISASGIVGTGDRRRLNTTVGMVAGVVSIAIGLSFVLGWEAILPDLTELLGGSIEA